MSDEDRRIGMNRLRYGFIAMVAASGAMVALQVEATLLYVAAGIVGGAVAGALLWAYLVYAFRQGSSRRRR
ncbi:hypothetical protein [Haloarchaeobius amylolyticus]|uniref:hypothetical protein n=1 Tax=Haloarchaeobius amylolyticus TaxID=1198296 RepID=UPI002270327D|nr:hypothetical protein [Haloarchaeobius amylolyticus]